MFSRRKRTFATAIVALAVVLSMAVGPAMAAQDDGGLLGGDDSDSTLGGDSGVDIGTDGISVGGDDGVSVGTDGVSVGGDSGVEAGTDGVSVGGDEGVNLSTDGVSVAGQDVGGDGLSDDGPVGTDGSNLEVGGDEGVSVGTDGVSVAGQDVGGDGLQGGDSLSAGDNLPGVGSGDIPTGPVPVDISYSMDSVNNGRIVIESTDAPRGSEFEFLLGTAPRAQGGQRFASDLEASGADRTYIDFTGDGTVSRSGLENADGAIYTVNESGGTYIMALSRDSVQAAVTGVVQGEQVGVLNVQNEPGTQKGTLAGGLNPANAPGPSLPVGPDMPERLGGGITCNGEECVVGTTGVGEQIPENEYTKPIKESDPLPLTLDQSGVLLPCNKPVGADDLPAEQLPGISDLPKGTLPGVPTSLLTNDAVLGLAFGAAPAPCEVTQPLLDPVANPAAEPGQTNPTFDIGTGGVDTSNGLLVRRSVEMGPGGNIGTADGFSAVLLNEEEQRAIYDLDVSNSEYQYVLIKTDTDRGDGVTKGDYEASLREDYAGIATNFEQGEEPSEFSGEVTPSVLQKQIIKLRLSCDASGCQPSYSGLPSLGALPEIPNPLAGGAGLPV